MGKLRFVVRNFAKVARADVDLQGVTVIVGENNSGKSTIGKALYALCSVFRNLDERVHTSKVLSVKEAVGHSMVPLLPFIQNQRRIEQLLTEQVDTARIMEILRSDVPFLFSPKNRDRQMDAFFESQVEGFVKDIAKIKNITVAQYREAVVWEYFENVFHSQVVPVFRNHSKTSLEILNGEHVKVIFDSASATIEKIGQPLFRVCYINGPTVANLLNNDCTLDALEVYDRELTEDLRGLQSVATESVGVVGARKVSNRIKLKQVKKLFDKVIPGSVGKKNKGKLSVNVHGGEPISFENLSSGLKSFVLLWQVLDQGLVSDGDVLILDEPEVRLHPEWQIVYAEIIVVLSMLFDLRVLLTSHSVDFIHALSLFVRKYGQSERLRLYCSSINANGSANIDPVENNEWEHLFDAFVKSVDILSEIRDSLPEEK